MMLGSTAGGLFWMFRYLERSENTARLLEAGLRIALTRSADASEEWASVLTTASAREAYQEVHDTFDGPTAVDFLLRDERNPSSVLSVIGAARRNARSVRTARRLGASLESSERCLRARGRCPSSSALEAAAR